MRLPKNLTYDEMEIFADEDADEVIAERLSDDYGYCVNNFNFELEELKKTDTPKYKVIITNIDWDTGLEENLVMSVGLLEAMCEYAINSNIPRRQYPERLFKAYLGVLALEHGLLSIEFDLKTSKKVGADTYLLIDNTGEIIKTKEKLSFATSKSSVHSVPDIFYDNIDWEKLDKIICKYNKRNEE